MRSLICRGLRLDRFAALGLAVALPAMAATSTLATQTTMSTETRDQGGRTHGIFSVAVTAQDGSPATGAVLIEDGDKAIAGAALDANGQAQVKVDLAGGDHALKAVYQGDNTHQASASEVSPVSAAVTAAEDFTISVNPAALTLTAGQSGNVVATVTPVNAGSASMFVTLSCSGFPDQSSCTFTPENIEILPNATAPVTSSMTITTQAKSSSGMLTPPGKPQANPVAWAVLLPGTLGLAGLAFSARRRRWLYRLSMMSLVAFVMVLGATACAPRYNYFNHGPPPNQPTLPGVYTLTVTAQSSNGVTATSHFATFALTVK